MIFIFLPTKLLQISYLWDFLWNEKKLSLHKCYTILRTLEPRLFISKRFVKETLFPSFPIIHLSFDIYICIHILLSFTLPKISKHFHMVHFHTFSNIDEHKFKILPIHSIDTRTWWKHSCHRSPFIARIDNFRDNTAARVILDAIEGDCARHRWNENAMECSAEVTIKGVDRSWETGVRCSR